MTNIDTLLDYLKSSQRPLILLGAGAREAAPDIIAFAERFDIPIETTWNAIDLIPWEHRLFVGRPGIVATRGSNFIIQECDLLLSIGARLDVQTVAFEYLKFAPKAVKVLVDVDEGEAKKIPNLDLFIHADAGEFIREMISESSVDGAWHEEWMAHCQDMKAQYGMEGTTITYELCNRLSDELTADDVLVISSTGMTGGGIFPAFFRQKAGQRIILSSPGLGSMGGGIPTAIGVALASGKRVICIDGDGSFMQNIQELEVVHRLNLNIWFYVVNNGGYASIRNSEMRAFGRTSGDLTLPDIVKVADVFGIRASRYFPAPLRLYGKPGPVVFEIQAPPDEELIPRVMFDGRGNMGDMYPYG